VGRWERVLDSDISAMLCWGWIVRVWVWAVGVVVDGGGDGMGWDSEGQSSHVYENTRYVFAASRYASVLCTELDGGLEIPSPPMLPPRTAMADTLVVWRAHFHLPVHSNRTSQPPLPT
jgi:hypothetical protein